MDLQTAPPPAEGRSLQFGNGGFNKALMPAQAGRLSPYNNGEEEIEDGSMDARMRGWTRLTLKK